MMHYSRNKTVRTILGREPVHPFPARMAPELALSVMRKSKKPLRILDPMSGSGTVLAVAHSRKHHAIGGDVDPLAVLISKVWTTPINMQAAEQAADETLVRARHVFTSLPTRDAYPKGSDEETRKFIRYWFDDKARCQLTALTIAISEVRSAQVRDVLWCAFSRLIIAKQAGASRAMDLSHSRPHRAFKRAPIEPLQKFEQAAQRVIRNCICKGRDSGPPARVYEGDARCLPLEADSIDLVITSPPYLNAIDYLRCSKFSLVWMGYTVGSLRRIRSESIGTEKALEGGDSCVSQNILARLRLQPALEMRYEAVLLRYIDDLQRIVKETARVLKDGGKAVYVIGENTMRGTFIPNASIVKSIAAMTGMRCTGRRSRELPANRRYLPPPSSQGTAAALSGRMRREVILTLQKVA